MSRTHRLTLHDCRLRAMPYLAAACLAALSPPLRAADTLLSAADQLQVGHWLEVRGALAADGSFVGEKAELQQPQAEDLLIGTMLLRRGYVDAMLCGVVGRHEQHLKHVADVIGLQPDAQCFAAMNMLLGGLIIVFVIFEPRGLVHRWNIVKESYRIWPFPH